MNRMMGGQGGEGRNTMFLTSFVVLCVMIIVLVSVMSHGDGNSGGDSLGGDGAPASSPIVPSPPGLDPGMKHPEFHRQVQSRPSNLSLLIVGNATAHYSYLSLVYYLRWGRWFDPGLSKSNLVNEYSFDNPFHGHRFGEFHYQTNVMLEPYELCDCHKGEHTGKRQYIYENRYFHDPHHNNTVTYIHAYGDEVPLQGRLEPSEVYDVTKWEWSNKVKGLLNPGFDRPSWKYGSWGEMITDYASKIKPKPNHAILEAGGFTNSFGPSTSESKDAASQIKKALDSAGIKGYWRTTIYDKTHKLTTPGSTDDSNLKEFDSHMCSTVGECIDLGWTKDVKSSLYWDKVHLYEPVHRVMNEEFLEEIGKLPKDGYTKYDKKQILE